MPLHQRQVLPINVARKYFDGQNGEDLLTNLANGGAKDGVRRWASTDSSCTPAQNEDEQQRKIELMKQSYVTNSKEEAANRVVANMIRQLASLSQNGHEMFGKPKWQQLLFKEIDNVK